MKHTPSDPGAAAPVAFWTAATLMAHQVSGKATRDALFLSSFDVTALPLMVVAAALFSIAFVLLTSRAMSALTPARLVPAALATSGLLTVVEWGIAYESPKAAAVLVYLHMASLSSLLLSGFWSLISERFDPRTAKRQIGRIAGGGTLGGLAGGLLAERVAAVHSVTMALPFLAALHLCAAWMARGLQPPAGGSERKRRRSLKSGRSGFRTLRETPYLRNLAALVLLSTVSAGIIDFVFKVQATAAFGKGEHLMRFFAVFYSAVALVTFAVQTGATRAALEKLGLAKTIGTVSAAVATGGLGTLMAPSLIAAGLTRGADLVLRGSLFRSGYELVFTPIPPKEKRATKSIIDVGFDRLGDAIGGGLVKLMLVLGPRFEQPALLGAAIAVSLAGLWVASRMNQAYVSALEMGLLDHALDVDLDTVQDSTTRSAILRTLSGFYSVPEVQAALAERESRLDPISSATPTARPGGPPLLDAVARQIAALRSGDPEQVRQALHADPVLNPLLVPYIIPLLAWDEVAADVTKVLTNAAPRIAGQLTDFLLDPEQDFAIRRRIPKALAAAGTERAAEGLLLGLGDRRFEVRFRAGRALVFLLERHPEIHLREKQVMHAVLREVSVNKRVWESHRLLDRLDSDESPFVEDALRRRSSRSLEHVFTLLSLVLPKEPLKLAYQGLHTTEAAVRGTALEYLESVLPPDVRANLWPFLEDHRTVPSDQRSRDEILADLMRSHPSMVISLADLQREASGPHPPDQEPDPEGRT